MDAVACPCPSDDWAELWVLRFSLGAPFHLGPVLLVFETHCDVMGLLEEVRVDLRDFPSGRVSEGDMLQGKCFGLPFRFRPAELAGPHSEEICSCYEVRCVLRDFSHPPGDPDHFLQ